MRSSRQIDPRDETGAFVSQGDPINPKRIGDNDKPQHQGASKVHTRCNPMLRANEPASVTQKAIAMHAYSFVIVMTSLGLAIPMPALAAPVWTGILGTQAAVGGYNSVSYFNGSPVEGSDRFTTTHKGATFRFATAENLATFKANPDRYAPQYGGHCASAAANNYRFAGAPKVWKVVDGKLYLNYNRDVQVKWEKDIPAMIASGNSNWAALGK